MVHGLVIVDAVEAVFRAEASRLDREQAVQGLDSLDELKLHPLVSRALQEAGFGVTPEQRYPQRQTRRRASEGERCDLVLTPESRPLAVYRREPTLFEPEDAVPSTEAFWLEIKVVNQFTAEGANRSYSSDLLSGVRADVAKLSRDPGICHAGLLLALFCRDETVARHDLALWLERCLDLGLPVGSPDVAAFPINDRLGNGCCAVALYPIWHEPPDPEQ